QASQLDDGSAPANGNLDYPNYPPFGPEWEGAARASEQTNAPVFKLMREARARPRAQLHGPYTTPLLKTALPSFTGLRRVATTLGDGADWRHATGDDVEAVQRLLDMLHLARSIHQDDTVVGQLVAIGVTALQNVRAQQIAPGLRLDSPNVR